MKLPAALWMALCFAASGLLPAKAAPWLDTTPRVAVISAFPAELEHLLGQLEQPETHIVNGVDFTTGWLVGKPVVLFLSGISMTNAAMSAGSHQGLAPTGQEARQ